VNILLIDELKACGSALEDEVMTVASRVFSFTSVCSALYTLHCALDKGAEVPVFDLLVFALAPRDHSVKTYDDAIRRLGTFFQAIRREMPRVMLVLDEGLTAGIVQLGIEVQGTIITERVKADTPELIEKTRSESKARQAANPIFYAFHT
jgi:hypothetical protein